MRNLSGPMLPVSSGTLPGQISTTSGLSAPTTGQVPHINMTRETVDTNRITDRKLFIDAPRKDVAHGSSRGLPAQPGAEEVAGDLGLALQSALPRLGLDCLEHELS